MADQLNKDTLEGVVATAWETVTPGQWAVTLQPIGVSFYYGWQLTGWQLNNVANVILQALGARPGAKLHLPN